MLFFSPCTVLCGDVWSLQQHSSHQQTPLSLSRALALLCSLLCFQLEFCSCEWSARVNVVLSCARVVLAYDACTRPALRFLTIAALVIYLYPCALCLWALAVSVAFAACCYVMKLPMSRRGGFVRGCLPLSWDSPITASHTRPVCLSPWQGDPVYT